jgi:cyclopropane-fatty-acyl-phospholipid synthase
MQHVNAPFQVAETWRWSGEHYRRTANAWLANFDRNETRIADVLHAVYAGEAQLWQRRWRLFFLATAGLFGYRNGTEWGISHYLLKPA